MFSFLGNVFETILKPLKPIFTGVIRPIWRWINPAADTFQAQLLKLLAGDIVREYLQRNPKTVHHVETIDEMIDLLRTLQPIQRTTAERLIRSTLYDLLKLGGADPSDDIRE